MHYDADPVLAEMVPRLTLRGRTYVGRIPSHKQVAAFFVVQQRHHDGAATPEEVSRALLRLLRNVFPWWRTFPVNLPARIVQFPQEAQVGFLRDFFKCLARRYAVSAPPTSGTASPPPPSPAAPASDRPDSEP